MHVLQQLKHMLLKLFQLRKHHLRNLNTHITVKNKMLLEVGGHKYKKAHFENRLPDKHKVLAKYRMLIIDEISYLPMDIQGTNLFFQLSASEHRSQQSRECSSRASCSADISPCSYRWIL